MIHPNGGHYLGAGAMALIVHGLFAIGLLFSMNWRSLPQLPVYADLWAELPPLPEAVVPPPPQPVEQEATPEPIPATTTAEPKAEIELKARQEQERQRLEAERREQVLRQRLEDERRRAQAAASHEREQQEAEARRQQAERQRQEETRRQQERARLELEEEFARQIQEDLAGEVRLLQRGTHLEAGAAARLKMIEDYRSRIRSKIESYLRLPHNLSGNPEVVYQVRLLPDGEVLKVTLLKSSGQPAYDRQVERAILLASPLPLPPDRELASAFREELILKFRPHDLASSAR